MCKILFTVVLFHHPLEAEVVQASVTRVVAVPGIPLDTWDTIRYQWIPSLRRTGARGDESEGELGAGGAS